MIWINVDTRVCVIICTRLDDEHVLVAIKDHVIEEHDTSLKVHLFNIKSILHRQEH